MEIQNPVDQLREAIAICQCCEDATNEPHIKTCLSIVIGNLLTLSWYADDLPTTDKD